MNYSLDYIELDNFKSYSSIQRISLADLSVLLGANSSGKSSALQALLVLKQTLECNSRDVELLLSGKYVALGDFDDVINNIHHKSFGINLGFKLVDSDLEAPKNYEIRFRFIRKNDNTLTVLNEIGISVDDLCIRLIRTCSEYFSLYCNDELLPIYVKFKDLHLSELFIRYDKQFNKQFVDFLNSLKKCLLGEKTTTLSSDSFVSYNAIYELFFEFFHYFQIKLNISNLPNNRDKAISELSDKISDLVDKYLETLWPIGTDIYRLPKEYKSNILYNAFLNKEKRDEIDEIYNRYSLLYSEYVNSIDRTELSSFDGMILYNDTFSVRQTKKVYKADLNYVIWLLKVLYSDFERQFSKLYYLGPIRENPKGLYSIGFEQDPKYVGPTGSNFASVLLHENRIKNYILPDAIEKTSLCDALNEWSLHLNIASSVEVSPATSFGIKVSVSDVQNNKADIMNVGIGTSQVLPVLITGLLSEVNEILIFEQPELHLHPFAQGRLVDFFISLAKNRRTVVIETHSEAIILRLRYHILKSDLNKESVAVNFFQNCDGTKVSLCNISGYGVINYPPDFRDETQELLNDILIATIRKNNI